MLAYACVCCVYVSVCLCLSDCYVNVYICVCICVHVLVRDETMWVNAMIIAYCIMSVIAILQYLTGV